MIKFANNTRKVVLKGGAGVNFVKYTIGLVATCIFMLFSNLALAAESRLMIDWPASWGYGKPKTIDNTTFLQAEYRDKDKKLQHSLDLKITLLKSKDNDKLVTKSPEDLKSLIAALRQFAIKRNLGDENAATPVQAYDKFEGYYFISNNLKSMAKEVKGTREETELYQGLEGVIFKAPYLIVLDIQSNDIKSAESRAMISALDKLRIDAK